MIDPYDLGMSLLIRDVLVETSQRSILRFLRSRFGPVPPELEAEVRSIHDETVLDAAVGLAASSPDLERFGADLRAIPRPPEPWDPRDEPEPPVRTEAMTAETPNCHGLAGTGCVGGKETLIESPLIREIVADHLQTAILEVLSSRFRPVSPELELKVRSLLDESLLHAAVKKVASCSELDRFWAELWAIPRPPERAAERPGDDGQDA